jgi:N utilization substance protein B
VSSEKEAPRHRSRDIALQVLYAMEMEPTSDDVEESPSETLIDDHFQRVVQNFEVPKGADEFGEALVRGVWTNRKALDEAIESFAKNWRVDRMTVIDRNILRVGAFELLHTETPMAVVIDQAVDLAHRFGADPSPGFVNGILDSLGRACSENGAKNEAEKRE